MIQIRSLTKTYTANKGKPFCALQGIDLSLPDTGLVFLLGKSGSGKTTMLTLFLALVAFLVPMLRIRHLDPVQILQAE